MQFPEFKIEYILNAIQIFTARIFTLKFRK